MAMKVEDIAQAAHEMNRMWCAAHGDYSQTDWVNAPQWQRDSAMKGVQKIVTGEITHPKDSHISWMEHKKADGWVYGEVKDPDAKTHPCMVPYKDLPPEQKAKDTIFFNTVTTLIAANSIGK